MSNNKICSKCTFPKLISEFYKDSRTKDGFKNICKECIQKNNYRLKPEIQKRIQTRQKKYISNPEVRLKIRNREREYQRKDRLLNPEKYLWRAAKARAKKYQIPFSLTIADIKIPQFCPVFGIALERGIMKVHDASPSLDRIKPELGYIAGNVMVISNKANVIKNNGSIEEHQKIIDWMKKYE